MSVQVQTFPSYNLITAQRQTNWPVHKSTMSLKLGAVGRVIKRRGTWDIRKNTNYCPTGKLQVLQMCDITNSGLQKLSWHSKPEHLCSDLIYYPNYVFLQRAWNGKPLCGFSLVSCFCPSLVRWKLYNAQNWPSKWMPPVAFFSEQKLEYRADQSIMAVFEQKQPTLIFLGQFYFGHFFPSYC